MAAALAWYLAVLLLPDGRPSFAAIAAVICLGASHGRSASKSLQLVAGVVLGITVASALVSLIGSGSLQIGLMVVLAMGTAVLLRGGELLTSEAAVSAILLVSLDPSASDTSFMLSRVFEGAIGGAVALAVAALIFPPDPALHVGRAAQAVFAGLGSALEKLATALERRDTELAREALAAARGLDPLVDEFSAALETGRETARLSPRRRRSLADLERYAASLEQVDFAIRNTRVMARHAARALRANADLDPSLARAVSELGEAVWALAGAFEQPERADAVRGHALAAGAMATEGPTEVLAQIRSTAVDLRRAADRARDAEEFEAPTEELLAAA